MQKATHDFVLAQKTTDAYDLPKTTTDDNTRLEHQHPNSVQDKFVLLHEKVKKAQTGDVMAFGELVKMFQDAVYGVAYAIVGNFEDAQDIAQEAFIHAWRNLNTLKDLVKFPNWLCRIARNLCIDFLRQRKLETVELEEAIAVHAPSPEPLEQTEKKELAESVLAAVRALPEKLRLTTTLFYINGYTVNEIAEFLEAPAGTIKRRLHDSRQRLKESIMKDKKMIEIMVDGVLKSFPLPGDFADVVVRLVASEEDLNGLVELGFGKPKSVTHGQRDEMFVVGEGEYVYSMDSHMTVLTQTILSLGGTYRLRPSCDVVGLDAEMVAIIDLVGLTQDLQDEFQLRLNASPAHGMDGCLSIEMSGTTVGFVVNSGHVEIVTQKQKVHRVLPRWVVTRLYIGYYSGEDVLAMGPIPYDRSDGKNPDDPDLDMKELHLPEDEAALFKALFPKLWPCSTPDPEVWPWAMGEEHPQYRDFVTPEMKAQIDALRFPWIGY